MDPELRRRLDEVFGDARPAPPGQPRDGTDAAREDELRENRPPHY